jgi:hypothetical protein
MFLIATLKKGEGWCGSHRHFLSGFKAKKGNTEIKNDNNHLHKVLSC